MRGAIVAVALATCSQLALAQQQFGQRLGDIISAPGSVQTVVPGPQTPTITNPATGTQKPSAAPPQPTGAGDVRPPLIAPMARPERNEFQDFIEQSTGRRLAIFGQELFEGA